MKLPRLLIPSAFIVAASLVFADEENPIKKAMQYAHKAPQGEKKIGDKIGEGTATEAEVKATLDAYKAMENCKPARGEQAAFKEKVAKLIGATEEVLAKKDGAAANYKAAVNCKACHSEHKNERSRCVSANASARATKSHELMPMFASATTSPRSICVSICPRLPPSAAPFHAR